VPTDAPKKRPGTIPEMVDTFPTPKQVEVTAAGHDTLAASTSLIVGATVGTVVPPPPEFTAL
jgi:hypothetical protein